MPSDQAGGAASPDVAPEGGAGKSDDDISDVRLGDFPAFAVFACLFAFVALQFFTRYVLNDSLAWTEEIARYFLVLLGFLGCVTCARKGSHIRLEFMHRRLSASAFRRVEASCEAVSMLFFGYCCWLGIDLAQRTGSNMVSVALPKAIIYWIVAASCAAVAAHAAAKFWRLIRTPA